MYTIFIDKEKTVSDQAVIALVLGTTGAIATLVFFLFNSMKSALDKAISEVLEKLDEFVDALSQIRERVAERTVAMTYIEREIDSIKKSCRRCQQSREKDS
jgi:hypothetical protein